MHTNPIKNKSELYGGIIWIVSAVALGVYALLLSLYSEVPGMGEIVKFLSSIDKTYVYLGAFISVFIEGLYFIGSFFPGASFVMIIAIIAGTSGYSVFGITLLVIFIGWSLAGIINVCLARMYRDKIAKLKHADDYSIKDRVWTTWFPAFRSSYEVAQVIEGGDPLKVYISSLRVRFWATLFVGFLALVIPLVLNVDNTSDKESFVTIFAILLISLAVGVVKVKNYLKS